MGARLLAVRGHGCFVGCTGSILSTRDSHLINNFSLLHLLPEATPPPPPPPPPSMRQKRAKAYKKQMHVYLHTFKFREPFQTIIDDEIITTCVKSSYDLVKGIDRTIQSESKPMITQCCIQALYQKNNQEAIDLAKRFERRRCNHPPKNPLKPAECIESITSINGANKHRYIVATQNYDLRKKLRKVPGVPLIFMNRSVMVMEPLSQASTDYSNLVEAKKLTGGLNDAKYAGYANKEEEQVPEEKETKAPESKKRKGPKGPNPLSVKKKKTETNPEQKETNGDSKKRRRKHKKLTTEGTEENAEASEPNTTEVSESKTEATEVSEPVTTEVSEPTADE